MTTDRDAQPDSVATESSGPDYRPTFPADRRLRIGILGCGTIAQSAHLPAYAQYGLDVAGVWSRNPGTTATVQDRFPFVAKVYATSEELLGDPDVDVVDLAMPPQQRADWLDAAVSAGKHVLAQKPLTDDIASLLPVLERAEEARIRIAVNQNARWAPPWRLATLLVRDGAVGDVVGVTHLHDKPLPPIAGTRFDDVPHMLVADYLVHWLDITRCWLEGKQVSTVRAEDHRTPGQPGSARNPWSATVEVQCTDGASASVRVVGNVATGTPSCPFWIHGTEGTVRGSLLGKDFVHLERDGRTTRYPLEGRWFVDGFAGAMGELMSAVVEEREPENSARNNLATLRLVDVARSSAEDHGRALALDQTL
ncbi:MAG TPA: Gfo/Idh/MocA family oxidoreductase [Nocardioidaceae bacterium]|nr:Gfo/Idh/MocA family oxidoreductase [Nocardioidaceae bacterium]